MLWRISHMLDTVKWDQHRPTAHKKLRLRQNTQNSSPASCIWDLPVAIQQSHGKMAHGQVSCLVWEVHTDCSIWNSLKVTWVTSAYERLFYCCFSELAQHNGFTPWYPEECFTGLKAAQSRLSLHHPFAALLGVGSTPRHSRRTGPQMVNASRMFSMDRLFWRFLPFRHCSLYSSMFNIWRMKPYDFAWSLWMIEEFRPPREICEWMNWIRTHTNDHFGQQQKWENHHKSGFLLCWAIMGYPRVKTLRLPATKEFP